MDCRVYSIRRVLLSFALMLSSFAAVSGSGVPTIQVDATSEPIELTPALRVLHDPGAERSFASVVEDVDDFQPLPDGRATFGFGSGAYWLHARLVGADPDDSQRILLLRYALIDHIDIYTRYADGRVVRQQSGDMIEFHHRAVPYRHPNVLIDLPHGEPVDLFVRAESKSSMQLPLALYTPLAFANLARDTQLGMGVYYGILLSLLVYNLILWLALRDQGHFWYLLHVGAVGMTMLTLYGMAFEYLWPDNPWLANQSIPLAISLSQFALHQFTRKFLELRERAPRTDRVARAAVAFFGLLVLSSFVLDYRTSVMLATAAVFPGVILILIAIVAAIRSGYRPAWLFLLAWSAFLLGTALYASVSFGLIEKRFLTEYGIQVGSALEMLLLSIALSYRYAALRNENERLVKAARHALEAKVAERTRELTEALAQLGEANARLREFSERDGLTGVFNRRHFHDALAEMIRASQQSRQPLTVLMADLDHFKAINDTYGHLAGDDCLRWVSQRMQGALREQQALLARFGGEEFVVALPGVDGERARELAEQLRDHVAAEPIVVRGHALRITVSIGMHCAGPDLPEPGDRLIERADQALYRAKAGGRNRVAA
ncbi:MAG TPA: hypothetical protein DDZ76_03485 [Xanthomonadales bacterium]|nr:hypothetical protein [Xanthomonadales bacterium]